MGNRASFEKLNGVFINAQGAKVDISAIEGKKVVGPFLLLFSSLCVVSRAVLLGWNLFWR